MINPVPINKDIPLNIFLNQLRDAVNRSIQLPTYTTTERNVISNWRNGETILNTTTGKVQTYISGVWTDLH